MTSSKLISSFFSYAVVKFQQGFALHPSSRSSWIIHPAIFACCLDALHCLTRLVLTNPENDTEEKTQNISNLAVLSAVFPACL